MTVWVSGASGFIGKALTTHLRRSGHRVIRLVRRGSESPDELTWDIRRGVTDRRAPEFPCDAVIHLAGVNVAGRRWSTAHARAVYDSRVPATLALSASLAHLPQKPRVMLCASGVGYYGDCADRLVTESSPQGSGFIADLCREWERACDPAREAGIRVVNLRTGLVLHPSGGALKPMLLSFRLGVGGALGNGRQYAPWIVLDDLVAMYEFALRTESLTGPCNAVGPSPVTMKELARTLGRVLHRPAIFQVPRAMLDLVMGKDLAGIVLASCRAIPEKVAAAGFEFQQTKIEDALRHLLT